MEIVAAHQAALDRGDPGYLDPFTGLFVFSALALAERPCCGSGCRHCPWVGRVDDVSPTSGDGP